MYTRNLIICLILGVLMMGCNLSKADKPATLTVTIDPQKYFLSTIVGNHFVVESIVPSGANPENADFTPSQMMSLDKSRAYFKVGYMGIENALIGKVLQSNPELKVVDCSEGIKIVGEHHHEDESSLEYGHAGGDPHTWSSVSSARIIAENMYKAVLELDKANEQDYTSNYNKLLSEFNHTDSIIRSYLDKAPSKSFIIYHPALSYFADEYGLVQHSIEHDGKSPSPLQLKQLIDLAKSEGIKVVFMQQEFDTKNAETVVEATGAKMVSINLLSYNWSDEMIKIAKALAQQ